MLSLSLFINTVLHYGSKITIHEIIQIGGELRVLKSHMTLPGEFLTNETIPLHYLLIRNESSFKIILFFFQTEKHFIFLFKLNKHFKNNLKKYISTVINTAIMWLSQFFATKVFLIFYLFATNFYGKFTYINLLLFKSYFVLRNAWRSA